MKHSLKAIFLDMDGTLADTMPALRFVFDLFLTERGATPTDSEFRRLLGPSLREVIADLKKTHGWSESEDVLLAQYNDLIAKNYTIQAKPFPDTEDFLNHLRSKNISLWLATSATQALAIDFLERNHLSQAFSGIISANDVTLAKPHPEIFMRALSLSAASPAEALAVDDSPAGILAAQRAGLKAIQIQHANGLKLSASTVIPDFIATSYSDIEKIVQEFMLSAN